MTAAATFVRRKLPKMSAERKATLPLENQLGQPWKQNTAAWGWQMWTPCMGTGAVCVLVSGVPYPFPGKHAIASAFLFIDIAFFVLNLVATVQRAFWHPKVFWSSFYSQSEGVWFPCANLALATLILGVMNLGLQHTGPWLVVVCEVFYWIYISIALCTGLIVQNTLRTKARRLEDVAPSDCLEVFPLMLSGTIGSVLAPHLAPDRAIVVIVVAYVLQGLGLWMSLLKLSVWMLHHITLERVPSRVLPSYIVALGPPGFTALALINLGTDCLRVFPAINFLSGKVDSLLAAQIFFVAGIWFALLLMGWCVWIFWLHAGWSALSLFKMIMRRDQTIGYSMSWWSWTFPLSGFISTLGKLAVLFPSKTLGVFHIIGTVLVFLMWLVNVYGTGHMILSGELPAAPVEWNQAGEDDRMKRKAAATEKARSVETTV